MVAERLCDWCGRPIPSGRRRDAETCSQSHRQARWRFRRALVRTAAAAQPLRLAYADPPYPKLARRYYQSEPDYAGEVDHVELVSRLQECDGWALSTSEDALPMVLSLLVGVDVSVAAWFRGERRVRTSRPLSSWEPVVYVPARRVVVPSSSAVCDALVHRARPRMTEPRRVVGQKPAAFAFWLFGLLGARPGDTMDDMFPGSGTIGRAWTMFSDMAPDASHLPRGDASHLEDSHASQEYSHDVSGATP